MTVGLRPQPHGLNFPSWPSAAGLWEPVSNCPGGLVWAGTSPRKWCAQWLQRKKPALLGSLGAFLENPCPIQGSRIPPILPSSSLGWKLVLLSLSCSQLHSHCPNPEQVLGKCLMKLWLEDSAMLTLCGQSL